MTTLPPSPSVQVVFLHLDSSPALEGAIRDNVAKLALIFGRITHCRVTVARVDHRHLHASGYDICFEIGLPRGPLVVRHRSEAGEDAHAAVHQAFHTVRRRFEEHVRKLRGDDRRHQARATPGSLG